ncbi:MAG: ABC transporter permease, partial [Chloroflexota bacterium]|nr:ABC transporter permease [Chloroflexota bacterium]
TDYFEFTHYVDSDADILQLVDRGEARVGIIIPPDFSTRLTAGKSANIQVFIDGSDPFVAQTALFAAETISQSAAVEIISHRIERSMAGGTFQIPIDLRSRLLYNPEMKRINFMIPGLVGAILQVQTLILTALAIVREREQGTLEQLIVTPIKRWELMLGKIIPYVIVAFFNVALTLALGSLWFRVPVKGDTLLLLALSLIFLLSSLGLGILISTVSKTQMQAIHLTTFVMLPAFILSGFIVPRENMPWLAYYAGFFLPITYFLVILRGIVLKGIGVVYLWKQVLPLAAFSVGVFATSVLAFHKRLE